MESGTPKKEKPMKDFKFKSEPQELTCAKGAISAVRDLMKKGNFAPSISTDYDLTATGMLLGHIAIRNFDLCIAKNDGAQPSKGR